MTSTDEMTPPDSGEAICRACRDGDHDDCVIANYRYVQPGPGCACQCPIVKPDSGEREDVKCPHGKGWYKSLCAECTPPTVVLPIPLAQRILAALEDFSPRDFRLAELKALAAELRECMGRKP